MIVSKKQNLICFALAIVTSGKSDFRKGMAKYLMDWIENMLSRGNKEMVVTYDTWLDYNHPKLGISNRVHGRVQWIDWMINELNKELK